ncbi:MAG: radical SAM protein [Candidatus Omnitrophica bacterium]|nr:radical SAM protein [Candidatus Omnitrophota bacterium]
MRVVLIQSPVWGTYDPPLALAQLAACLRDAGHSVFVLDINIKLYKNRKPEYRDMWAWEHCEFWHKKEYVDRFFEDNREAVERFINMIRLFNADAVCFSVASSSRLASIRIASLIKERMNKASVIFGGPLFYEPDRSMDILDNDFLDFVVYGEGEKTIIHLLDILSGSGDPSLCRGLLFKKGAEIINTGARELIKDLDELPFLDFTGMPLGDYDDAAHIILMASRGCVFRCAFCSSRSFWPGYRAMSGERIYNEIAYRLCRIHTASHFNFMDLLINGNMKTLFDFCDCVSRRPFSREIYWTANAIIRPEMTLELMKGLRRTGCVHLIFGIESGSQRVLNLMRKNYNVEAAHRVLKAAHDAGIMTTGNFMFGFPGETEEDFELTLGFLKKNAPYLDRAYPSRTYCAIEENSYFHSHPEEFGVEVPYPNHLYWRLKDGTNTYPERLMRCERFSLLAASLGIEVGCGVQTSVELERWFSLACYYDYIKDRDKALDCLLKYKKINPDNEMVASMLDSYDRDMAGDSGKR